ncbi:PLD nuclease N-terminal domain-containing protein [Hymenobacter sp. ASUV-10]|uniref:PLD nuclease N-terminal domain-containing protein n=1 Tax=Hymenobacter aranciens TaxID=3063996 RepID=A0ABT9B660_9BACT|nr:PLD nuclease N-terminal domain-containing protein [Hymenobacter sp. ASUV-10]MDO7873143.1 PLD nuclease N-terminal domain-containing protein [Hymenobacter sp. ASUV-10]
MRNLLAHPRCLPLAALLLPLMAVVSSCSRYNDNGSLSIVGVLYLILAVLAVISLLKQDWTVGKKIVWGLVIWFFPVLGSIIYFLFSGRK